MSELQDRVNDLLAWTKSRIAHCLVAEAELDPIDLGDPHEPELERVELVSERRALQVVLRLLTAPPASEPSE